MTQTPAGWYPEPDPAYAGQPDRLRYWDGSAWTEHVHVPQPVMPPPAPPVQQPPAYPGDGGFAPIGPGPTGHVDPVNPAFGYQSYPAGGTPGQYPGYAQQPTYATTPDGQRLAGWWWRVLAALLDGLIALPLYFLVAVPVIVDQWEELSAWGDDIVNAAENGTGNPPNPALFDPTTSPGLALVLSLLVAAVLYNVVFLRWKQATPGKLIVGLRVRRRDTPGPLPWSTIGLRVGFVAALSVLGQIPIAGALFGILSLLDYLWPLWDSKKQALHDKVAGTNVVKIN
jgi:uncharacterized RDD family membrane protein YckC